MLRIVAGAGSRPVRRCTACWICWHQSRPAIPSRETGALPGWSAMTSPSRRTSMLRPGVGIVPPRSMIRKMHQATSRRIGSGRCDRSTPARQVPSWQNAPAYCGGTVSGANRNSRIWAGHRRPQGLQRLRVGPAAGGLYQVQRRLAAAAGHEHAPAAVAAGAQPPAGGERLPLRGRLQVGVLGDMRIQLQSGLHIGVPEPAGHHMHRDPRQQQGRGMRMTQPVRRPRCGDLAGQLPAQPATRSYTLSGRHGAKRLPPPRFTNTGAGSRSGSAASAPASHSCHRYSPYSRSSSSETNTRR